MLNTLRIKGMKKTYLLIKLPNPIRIISLPPWASMIRMLFKRRRVTIRSESKDYTLYIIFYFKVILFKQT